MEGIVLDSIKRILKQSSRRHKDLREACASVQAELEKGTATRKGENSLTIGTADKYFHVFKLACETRNARMMEIALHGIEKLIAFGYLRGGERVNEKEKLVDVLIKTINECIRGSDWDDSVCLQVIKALLTAVTSGTCAVQEDSLRLTVSAIFNIYLTTSDSTNQTTAKACLTQLVNSVMQRMEQVQPMPTSSAVGAVLPTPQAKTNGFHGPKPVVNSDTPAESVKAPAAEAAASDEGAIQSPTSDEVQNEDDPDQATESVDGKESEEQKESMATVSEKLDDPMGEAEAARVVAASSGRANTHEVDAFHIFRALCKISGKSAPVDPSDLDSVDMRRKMLSLELLYSMLKNSGPIFRKSKMFVTAVRQYLCTELLKHGLSLVVPVFQISLNIFQMLIVHFKIHLKTEMGVFLNNIILRVLESAHSTFQHKSMVLRFLQRICTDPQTIVDVYLNYDCDLKHLNIFGRIVQCLCRIAQGTHVSENWISAAEDFELKQSALSCLVSLVQSLMEWSKALDNHDDEASRAAHPEVEERTERAGVADAHDGSNHFASLKQKKMGMEEAVFRFNQKPKRGLEYLRTNKLIGDEPEDVVSFFRNSSGIDKTTLGEYLGEGDPFNIKVLYAYVDSLNFKGLPFDDALRFFLQDFRLPGEAQKIDRMMEKFAERYISTNGKQVPSKTCGEVSFANADTGYVLAYSIIMLNTDAHNPMVKNKMTKEGFQKNNRGINDGADLPAEFLSEIYDRIYNDEIKITDNKGAAANAAAATTVLSPKQKQMLFHTENETILKRSQDALAEGKTGETSVFHRATPGDHVRELFEVAWAPLLATFSVILEQYGASVQFREMMLMCLEAFKHSIRVLSVFYMETERDAFIAALAKFTQLGELDSLREMGQMNIESIKVLIGVAQQNGNYLGSSWAQVLRCVSSLERLQMISCGGKTELDRQHSSAVEQLNSALLIDTIDSVAVDSIFTNSVNLGSDAIVEFAKHLSEVSKEEIKCAVPRTFSMQKIVEISYFNMNRVRIVWSRLWAILGDHLTSIALSSNASLSMFAIDSLKQLSIKFLEKEELANYSFQHEFMKPFDMVLANSPLAEMRELTLQCIRQIVQSRSARIKSGWKNIFSALSLVTRDKDKAIVKFAADILHMVVSDCFGQFNEMFVECVNCLVAFACNRHSAEIAVQSVDGIEKCADELALGQIVAPSNADKFGDDEEAVRLWFPVLTGLSRVIMDPRLDVRTRSLNALFGMLRTHGSLFSPKLWQLVFRGVLFPIFDDVKYACEYVENDWLHTTCFSAFHLLIEVFSQFFVELDELVFSDLLELISHAMKQDDDRVASIGVACYISFVNSVEKHPSAEQWQDIIAVLVDAISSSSLDQLKPVAEDQELDAPTDESSTLLKRRCAVMLQYLEAVGPLARSEACCQGNLSGAMRNLVQELTSVHATCTACKSDSTWRERLESSGWAARVADLAQHQATSWSVLVRLLVCMCASGKLSDMQAELDQITNLTTSGFQELSSEGASPEMVAAAVLVVRELSSVPQLLESAQFKDSLLSLSEGATATDELKAACAETLKA